MNKNIPGGSWQENIVFSFSNKCSEEIFIIGSGVSTRASVALRVSCTVFHELKLKTKNIKYYPTLSQLSPVSLWHFPPAESILLVSLR